MKLLRRIPALIVVLAVLALGMAWAAHRHPQDLASDSGAEHCEFCLQVGRGTAPTPAVAALVAVTLGWTLWLVATGSPRPAPQPFRGSQQARAPPR